MKARKHRRESARNRHTITLSLEGDALPTEFRLFTQGWNDSKKGKFLFDAVAARSVMAAAQSWGVDLMIDLEHQSLEVEPGAADPTARDARGWCRLELRNGELWAVGVTWTPDGAERLTNKTQRYVSPAFEADPKTKRVSSILNVAITAIPATHHTPALVAASAREGMGMDPELVLKALEAIESGDTKAGMDILKGMIASAAGAGPAPEGDADGGEGDGAEGVPTTEAVEDPKVVDANADPTEANPKGPNAGEDDDTPAKKTERKAMHRMLCVLTGKPTLVEAVAEVETFRASHLTLETERKKLSADRALLESAERRKLVVELVTLGAEFPATVWADDKATAMKPRWANLPIAELRAHVADQRAARTKTKKTTGTQPANTGDAPPEVVALTADELKACADMKCDPKVFATLKALRDGKGN